MEVYNAMSVSLCVCPCVRFFDYVLNLVRNLATRRHSTFFTLTNVDAVWNFYAGCDTSRGSDIWCNYTFSKNIKFCYSSLVL